MIKHLSILLLLFCIGFSKASWSQIDPDSIFNRNILIQDIYSLKKTILDSHPNPYAFCTKEEFTKAFGRAAEKIDRNMPLKEYVRIVQQAMAVMKDSHSGIEYSHLQKMQINNGFGFIPVRMHSANGQLYVEMDRDSIMPKGARVVCIDNIEAIRLYQESVYYAHIEGNAITGQRRISDAIFPFVVELYHDLPDTVKIDVEPFGTDTIITFAYPLFNKESWAKRQKYLAETDFQRTVGLDFYRHDSLAVLRVGTFSPNNGKRYRDFIDGAFKEIKKRNVKYVAIDIRGNGGGQSTNVEYLYSFLDLKGYNTPDNIIGKASTLSKSRNKLAGNKTALWLMNIFNKKNEDVMGFVKLSRLENGLMDTVYFSQPRVQDTSVVYTGQCALFINGLTASAGVDFTNAFLSKKRGEVLGEPCLGPKTGTFGNPALYTLPNTKLRLTISTIRYNYDDTFQYEPNPLKPTIDIPLRQEDLAKGIDPCVNYVIYELLKK